MPGRQLRALSLRQPHAEAVLRGIKTTEYRSGPTAVRGVVYLYASRVRYERHVERQYLNEYGIDDATCDDLPRGVVVGTAEIYDCDGGEWYLRNAQRLPQLVAPNADQKPQPIWFYPFGRPKT